MGRIRDKEKLFKESSRKNRTFIKFSIPLSLLTAFIICIMLSVNIKPDPIFDDSLEKYMIDKSEKEIWNPSIAVYTSEVPLSSEKCIALIWTAGNIRDQKEIYCSFGKEVTTMSEKKLFYPGDTENPLPYIWTSDNSVYYITFLKRSELYYKEAMRCLTVLQEEYPIDNSNIRDIQMNTFQENIDGNLENILVISYIQQNSIQNFLKFIKIDISSGERMGQPTCFYKETGNVFNHIYIKRYYSSFFSSEDHFCYFLFYKETAPVISVKMSRNWNLGGKCKTLEIAVEDLEHFFVLPDKNCQDLFLIIYTNKTKIKIGKFRINPDRDYKPRERIEIQDICEFKKDELGGMVYSNSRVHFCEAENNLYVTWTVENKENEANNSSQYSHCLYAAKIEMGYGLMITHVLCVLASIFLSSSAFFLGLFLMPHNWQNDRKKRVHHWILITLVLVSCNICIWALLYFKWNLYQLGVICTILAFIGSLLLASISYSG